MNILILADHTQGRLLGATAHVIAAAQQLALHGDARIDVLVAGHQVQGVAEEAATLAGIDRVLYLDSPVLEHQLAEPLSDAMQALAEGYSHILGSTSAVARGVLPRVAALRGVGQLSEVVQVLDGNTFKRPIYAGNALVRVRNHYPLQVLTIRTTSFDAVGKGAPVAIDALDTDPGAAPVQWLSVSHGNSARPELTEARIIVSGGRGVGNVDGFRKLEGIADKLGAAIGASRAVVDAGIAPNELQVGQTGKIVAPDLYLAVGISGAIQHLAGIKDSRVIVAINQDEDAPIFQVADYGLVADLFEVIPQLEALL